MRSRLVSRSTLVRLLCFISGCAGAAGLFGLGVAMTACKGKSSRPGTIGAVRPWVTYEAEEATTNGSIHGPSRQSLTIESEASGRKFVRLTSVGQYVEFAAMQAGNAIVVRYSVPDAPSGGGIDATLSLYIDGKMEKKLPLTSRYSWIYGDFPWSNDPAKGKPHHFYDEAHAIIREVKPGQIVRLQKDASDQASEYIIDCIELEKIDLPLQRPAGSLSLMEFGALPNDGSDASSALLRALEAARVRGKTLWIPEGEFRLAGPRIKLGDVRVQGAGMWYSKFTGKSAMFEGTGNPVTVSDLAIFGEIDRRVDDTPDNAFHGNFGKGSVFSRLWIEHLKCGFWTTHGTERMRVEGCRIRNVMADGLNFCDGTSDSTVENCHLRNTGDDALATWSTTQGSPSRKPCVRNSFLNNTIESPWLANGIALYGGRDHLVARNLMVGTVFSGAGILVSSGFNTVPFRGTIRIEDNLIKDAGGDCYIGENVGGFWVHAKDTDIDALISISRLRIEGGPASGLTIHGPKAARRIELRDSEIIGVAEHGIEAKPTASGALSASGLRIIRSGRADVRDASSGKFAIDVHHATH